jgi:hypothetical protein
MKHWALRETLLSKKHGMDLYFWKWTPIGPATTSIQADAETWETEALAEASTPLHAMTFWEPVLLGDVQ